MKRLYRGQPHALSDLVQTMCDSLEISAREALQQPGNITVESIQRRFQSAIRSSAMIFPAHQWVAGEFHRLRVPKERILFEYPIPIVDGEDRKNVDVLVLPEGIGCRPDEGIAVGVKGHLMNKSKNTDNNANAARGDVTTLHESHPNMVVGRFDVTLTHELNLEALTKGHIVWERWPGLRKSLGKRTNSCGRIGPEDQWSKAEAAALVLIDPTRRENITDAGDRIFIGMDRKGLARVQAVLQSSLPEEFAEKLLAIQRERHPLRPLQTGAVQPLPAAALSPRGPHIQPGQQGLF